MPQITYGPPGHHGVTRLVAVGDAEYGTTIDRAVTIGTAVAGATWLAGLMLDSGTLRGLGTGATLALLAVRYLGRRPQVVAAAPPAPVAGWS